MESPNVLSPSDWQEWSEFVRSHFGAAVSAEAAESFRLYLAELMDWNARMNLVSVRSPREVLWRHFADSLAGLKAMGGCRELRAADIGTGAGLPGLPLKLACPGLRLTLVESVTKKCSFLAHLVNRLALPDVTILNGRAEEVGRDPAHRAHYDIVLSRAVTKLSPNIEIALPLLAPGGRALVYKTERLANDEDERRAAARSLAAVGGEYAGSFCYRLPAAEQTYCILAYTKTKETPAIYPRRTGIPEKKPL